MKFGSLFAGIGGIDLGLERAGMECAWQVEIDEFCQKVLNKHWPNVPKFGDIRDVGKHNLETVDLIAGGFPCQPFSVAGKRKGTADDRHLWPEMLRVISELKPTWVIGENVPGIIPLFLDQAISDLESEGYETEQFVIPACAVGAPHRRDRLFIIAYSDQNGQSGKPKHEREGQGQLVCDSEHYGQLAPEVPGSITQRGDRSKAGKIATSEPERPSVKCSSVAHANSEHADEQCGSAGEFGELRQNPVANGQKAARQENGETSYHNPSRLCESRDWRAPPPQPTIRGMDNGISNRVERIRALGNAVVPQVAEHIGRMIMEVASNS